MKFGIAQELVEGERRVAIVPAMVGDLIKLGGEVLVERNAGAKSDYSDKDYEAEGAKIVDSVYDHAGIILKIQPPSQEELNKIKDSSRLFGLFWVVTDKDLLHEFMKKKLTVFSMELVPRISRAQYMDVLSSMSAVAGYRSVLLAAEHFGRFFPLLMTAAGKIPPANVLVIGAGVAGLQAIATAKRLGAKVDAFDTRAAVKEQVESLGARFVEMEMPEDMESDGGYAKEATAEFIKKEREAISAKLPKTDIMITTAQVFGKKAPVIVTEEMIKMMPQGAVIVDIAAEQGGNTELTVAGKTIKDHGVTIVGPINLPSYLASHASAMYSRNLVNLLKLIYGDKEKKLDLEDEVIAGCCVLSRGEIVSKTVKMAFGGDKDDR